MICKERRFEDAGTVGVCEVAGTVGGRDVAGTVGGRDVAGTVGVCDVAGTSRVLAVAAVVCVVVVVSETATETATAEAGRQIISLYRRDGNCRLYLSTSTSWIPPWSTRTGDPHRVRMYSINGGKLRIPPASPNLTHQRFNDEFLCTSQTFS